MEIPDRLRFACKAYRRSFRVPVRTSHGVWPVREGVLVRVENEEGRCGYGEIAPIDWFGTETFAGALAWCAGVPAQPSRARLLDLPRGMPCCAAAVHAALEGLARDFSPEPAAAARAEGRSVSGGAGARPAPDEQSVPVAYLLPAGEPARAALERAADHGFLTFKLKIGASDLARESTLIDRLVDGLPPGGRLRLDANGGLDVRGAMRWLDAAARWPVEFVEQPMPPSADREIERLAADQQVPVALDESVRSGDDLRRWRDRGWRGVFVIKPGLAGAPGDWLPEVLRSPGQFVFSSALETAVGTAAGLRLAARAGLTRALGYGVGAFFDDDGLGGGVAAPRVTPGAGAVLKPEDVWNRL